MGHVIFIGAGPGAADLITVRGAQRLASAEVVLFDALTDAITSLADEGVVAALIRKPKIDTALDLWVTGRIDLPPDALPPWRYGRHFAPGAKEGDAERYTIVLASRAEHRPGHASWARLPRCYLTTH